MALALAVGDQQLDSNEETLQFRLGEPQAGYVRNLEVGW